MGRLFEPANAWSQARASYALMLDLLKDADAPLVLKLIVPLTPVAGLEASPPGSAEIESQVDHLQSPPMLVVHAPVFQRSWTPDEEYRRPYDADVFADRNGVARAQALYVVARDQWELMDGEQYRRYLLFERVQP